MDADDPLVGQILDRRYRVSQRLSHGGAGIVYKAQHTRLDRSFAVKVMAAGLETDEEAVTRFEREARLTSRFTHPNIVEITDFGVDPVFGIYLVMEFVPGVTVAQLINWNGRLSPAFAIDIAQQVCSGMGAAHSAGIIHRDLKSLNVMVVEQDDGPPSAKILDFGIAALEDGGGDAAERLTRTGILLGTPTYMSPEQGLGKRADHLADVYSFGVVLYEMLSGRPPLKGNTPFETLKLAQFKEPLPPRRHVPDADWPEALDELVMKCLRKKKFDRPQSFKIIAATLDDIAAGLGDDEAEDKDGARPTQRIDLSRALEALKAGEDLDARKVPVQADDPEENKPATRRMEAGSMAEAEDTMYDPIPAPEKHRVSTGRKVDKAAGTSQWGRIALLGGMVLLGMLAMYVMASLLGLGE